MTVSVTPQPDGSHVIDWTGLFTPEGADITLNKVEIANVAASVTSYTDPTQLTPGASYVYGIRARGTEAEWAIIEVPVPPPPPPVTVPIWGAYSDSHPGGTDDSVNSVALEAYLQSVAPAGQTVHLTGITTYSGGDIAGFIPLNGVNPPAGTKILLALALGNGTAYTAGGETLLAQCQAMEADYVGLFQRCLTMVGPGNLITRVGYEWNGNWSGSGYPSGGVGNFVLYPPADTNAAIAYIAGLQKNVDPASLTDFNLNGNGPNNQLDQFQEPAINRCPLGNITLTNGDVVPAIDIISCDNGYNNGNSDYGFGHIVPWIELAVVNKKNWAIPELATGDASQFASDGVLFIQDNLNLALGNNVVNRQTGTSPASYQAPYPAVYVSFFSSDDGGQTNDLQDADNVAYATAAAALIAT